MLYQAGGWRAQVTPTRVQLCLMDALLREREATSQDFASGSAPHHLRRCMVHHCHVPAQSMHVCLLPEWLPSTNTAFVRPLRAQPADCPPGSSQPMQVAER